MRITIRPGSTVGGDVEVPGDKSIAHRWLILAATARGRSELRRLPAALDVWSTATVLAALTSPETSSPLEAWADNTPVSPEGERSTSNRARPRAAGLTLVSRGRVSLRPPAGPLDCGNSGTTMRLMCGVLAGRPFAATLVGDRSLSTRPMERVAGPLRAMGAETATTDGHPPVRIRGGPLRGIEHRSEVPSAQVKGAVLLAGLEAAGPTWVHEPAPTRDHTERALAHLGAPVRYEGAGVGIEGFEHEGFAGSVPGDVSSAAFLLAAAAIGGRAMTVRGVGVNPSRTAFLGVLRRMGVAVEVEVEREELGEPVGRLHLLPTSSIVGTEIGPAELPLVIDEVPVLALLAANAEGATSFRGARELRVKEVDRLSGLAAAIRGIGGAAEADGDDLIVGGGGLRGGRASSEGDHRLAMALAVGGIGARSPVEVHGIEAAEVSFPGFVSTLTALGAAVES